MGSAGKLGLKLLVLVVEAGESLAVEDAVVTAVVDPGVVIDTDDVGSLIPRLGESWEGEEASGHSIWRKLVSCWALEPYHTLGLFVAVGHTVRVVTDMLLRGVRKTLVTGGLVGNSFGALNKIILFKNREHLKHS